MCSSDLINNPRVEPYVWDETDRRQVSGYNTTAPFVGIPVPLGDVRVTTANSQATNNVRVPQQTGEPPNGLNQQPGTDLNSVTFRTVINAANNGIGVIRLTLNTTNGMITGQNVIVNDVGGVSAATGQWTITVINTNQIDLQGSSFSGVYTSGGYVINTPSLPYQFDEVPKTGPL